MDSEKRRKKILFFVPLPPPVHGASLRSKSLVESKLINDAFNIEVIRLNFAVETDDVGKFSVGKVVKSARKAFGIIYKMITFKPDLVYFVFAVYGFALYRDLMYGCIFKLFSPKVLYHLRTQGVKSQIERSKFKRGIFRYVFKNTRVICLSEFLSRDIADVYPIRPMVINNGIEDVTHGLLLKKQRNTIVEILFLSNFAKTKGVEELIKAFAILKSKNYKFIGLIVGGPVDLTIDNLQVMIDAHDLGDDVKIMGPKYGDDKHEILNHADIFVLPTYFEAFPGSILEAMQFGLPVVSTFEGAIPEIVDDGQTGLLVNKQSPVELAQKMELLINSPDLRLALGASGRTKFIENYTLAIFERKMKEAFDEVLHGD